MPTRGASPYFAEALESALAEEPAEVIVVADGARLDEADARGARVIELEHVGRSRARNAGVDASRTEYVAFLDDDDLARPGRLDRQAFSLDRSPGAALSFGRVVVVDGNGRPLHDWNALLERRFERLAADGASFENVLATQCPIYTSATMVRRDAFLETGGYDPGFDAYEDLDLYLRLARSGGLAPCVGEAVAEYRLHGQNTPSTRLYEGALGVTRKHLPGARGRARRLLLERRIDALWGLGRFAEARREALRAAFAEPLLLAHRRFAKRLAGSVLPERLLRARV